MISITPDLCTRCGSCIRDCIVEVLKFDDAGYPVLTTQNAPFCIHCQHCLAICPTGALSCDGVSAAECAPIASVPDPAQMRNLIRQRRSIRSYRPENLPSETIAELKEMLSWAPTGCNDHRLFFTVIEDKSEMEFFRTELNRILKWLIRTGIMRLIYPNYKRYLSEIEHGRDVIFRNAPHMIVAATPRNAPCKEADPWIALTQFDLHAQTLGVGSCWCGFAVYAFRWCGGLRKRLRLPAGYRVGAVMLFGTPAVRYARSTKPEKVNFSS